MIGDVRRLHLEDFGGGGEELAAGMVSTVIFGGVFMSMPGSTVPTAGMAALPQFESGVILVRPEELVHGGVSLRVHVGLWSRPMIQTSA